MINCLLWTPRFKMHYKKRSPSYCKGHCQATVEES